MEVKSRVLFVGESGCQLSLSERELMRCLPTYLSKLGCEVSVVVPYSSCECGDGYGLAERLFELHVELDGRDEVLRVLEGKRDGGGPIFYLRGAALEDSDVGIRYGVFSRAVCEFLEHHPLGFDVVVCQGLCGCLVPVFLKELYAGRSSRTDVQVITSLGDWRDKGACSLGHIRRLGLPSKLESSEGLEFYGKMSILKGAYLYSDAIVLPSKQDVKDILSGDERGELGMEGVLLSRKERLYAIPWGIDGSHWDPRSDREIASCYHEGSMEGKARCKEALCKELGIKDSKGILMCYLGLMIEAAGLDLISDILDDLIDNGANLLFVGHGDELYVNAIRSWSEEFPGRVVLTDCDLEKVRRVLAGSDCILLPSHQQRGNCFHLYGMRYGTVPVARRISSAGEDLFNHRIGGRVERQSNGFVFEKYDADQFFDSAMDAVETYADRDVWAKLQSQAMAYQHEWSKSAQVLKGLFRTKRR